MKKKLLSIILMVAIVLTMVVSVAACKDDKSEAVTAAASAFRGAHISDKYDNESYDLVGTFTYEKVTYAITWTSDSSNVSIVPSADGKTVKVTVTKTSEAQEYKLIATLSDGEGNTATAEFRGSITANANADGGLGKTYKLAIRQLTKGTVLYAKAAVAATYYLDAATVMTDGADFFTEDVEGGKKIYTMVGVNKCYLGAKVSGNFNNICLGGVVGEMNAATYEGSVWTISDNEIKTVIGDKTLYLGTYGDKTTFSLSTYKTYPAFLVEAGTEVKPQAQIKVAAASSEHAMVAIANAVEGVLTVDVGTTVSFTVTVDEGHELVNVTVGGEPCNAVEGVYTLTLNGACEIMVTTKDNNAAAIDVDSIKFDFSLIKSTSTTAVTDLLEYCNTAVGEANSYLISAVSDTIYVNTGSGGAHPTVSGMLKAGKSKAGGKIILTFEGNVSIDKVEIKCHDFYAKNEANPTTPRTMDVNSVGAQSNPYNETGEFETLTFNLTTPTNIITIESSERAYILEIIVYLAK